MAEKAQYKFCDLAYPTWWESALSIIWFTEDEACVILAYKENTSGMLKWKYELRAHGISYIYMLINSTNSLQDWALRDPSILIGNQKPPSVQMQKPVIALYLSVNLNWERILWF